MLRAQAELHVAPRLDLVLQLGRAEHLGRERDVDVLAAEAPAAAVGRLERAVDEVHRRGAQERGDEHVRGAPVDVLRRADLLQHAVAHHGDPVPHRHRLDLVVGHVHRRDAEPRVQLDQLQPGLDPQLRVEVRERLVHQERIRLADDRARERDALPLPAGELARVAVQQLVERQDPGGAADGGVDLGLGLLGDLEREGDVREHGHVRVERVVLEDHRDVPLHRVDEVHEPAPDHDLARVGVLEPGDGAQDRALPAPRRPEQDEELAVGDLQRDVGDRLDLAEALHQMLDHDVCHATPSRASPGRPVIA